MHDVRRNDTYDLIECGAVAAKFISTIRQVVNQEPCLLTHARGGIGGRGDVKMISKGAKRQRERWILEQDLYQKLSRYYPRTKGGWTRGELLSKRKKRRIRPTCDISFTHLLLSCTGFGGAPSRPKGSRKVGAWSIDFDADL